MRDIRRQPAHYLRPPRRCFVCHASISVWTETRVICARTFVPRWDVVITCGSAYCNARGELAPATSLTLARHFIRIAGGGASMNIPWRDLEWVAAACLDESRWDRSPKLFRIDAEPQVV